VSLAAYPMIRLLRPGQKALIPWELNEDGETVNKKAIYQAAARVAFKTGRRFRMRVQPAGMRVERIV